MKHRILFIYFSLLCHLSKIRSHLRMISVRWGQADVEACQMEGHKELVVPVLGQFMVIV